jgi:hypothetical protein
VVAETGSPMTPRTATNKSLFLKYFYPFRPRQNLPCFPGLARVRISSARIRDSYILKTTRKARESLCLAFWWSVKTTRLIDKVPISSSFLANILAFRHEASRSTAMFRQKKRLVP